jgi:hypothetical protein
MFDSLDEQMKKDDDRESTPNQRRLRWLLAVVVTVIAIGGLYVGLMLMEHA